MKKQTYKELEKDRRFYIAVSIIFYVWSIIIALVLGLMIDKSSNSYKQGFSDGQMNCSNEDYTLYKMEGIENKLIVSDRPCNPIPCPQEHSVYQLNYCIVCKQ